MQTKSVGEPADTDAGARSWSETQLHDEVYDLLLEETDLTAEEIDERAAAIRDEYDGLVGDTGSLYLLAYRHDIRPNHELGREPEGRQLAIGNVLPDMHDLRITVDVARVFGIRHVGEDDTPVRNIIVKDDTGKTQIALWEDDVDAVEDVEEGGKLRIEGGYPKENDYCADEYGCPVELRVGDGRLVLVGEDGNESTLID